MDHDPQHESKMKTRVTPWPDPQSQVDVLMELKIKLDEQEKRINESRTELNNESRKLAERLAKEREKLVQERIDQQAMIAKEQIDRALQWIELQRQADRDLQIEREKIRQQGETERAKLAARQPTDGALTAERLALLEQRHQLELEQMRIQFEARIAEVKAESERNTKGFPVPKDEDFLRWYWERRIEEQHPAKSWVESLFENIEPIADFLGSHPSLLTGILRKVSLPPTGSPVGASPPTPSAPQPEPAHLISLDDEGGDKLL